MHKLPRNGFKNMRLRSAPLMRATAPLVLVPITLGLVLAASTGLPALAGGDVPAGYASGYTIQRTAKLVSTSR